MSTEPAGVPPVRREILVDADPATAFDVFTERIGHWWPLDELSVYGTGGTVGFADGRLVERSEAGEATVWGTVTRWEPAAALAFTWHPGGPPGEGMTVLRLPGAGQLDRAADLATKEDSSVAGGFFTVTVRPWQVMLQGAALGR